MGSRQPARFHIANAPGPARVAWLALVLLLIGLPTLVVAVALLRAQDVDELGIAFDAAAWRAVADTSGPNARGDMTGDLMRRHLPVGASRAAVTQLIGKPDWVDPAGQLWIYHLGPQIDGRLAMDPYTLELDFRPDGGLGRVSLVQH
ncbi:MAG: hypothetical protein HZB16_14005 [Armatimonadetes bacterium]|nr:hypothetical protein [Armatimonadota bacterium]